MIVIILNKPHCCEKLISLIIKYLASDLKNSGHLNNQLIFSYFHQFKLLIMKKKIFNITVIIGIGIVIMSISEIFNSLNLSSSTPIFYTIAAILCYELGQYSEKKYGSSEKAIESEEDTED